MEPFTLISAAAIISFVVWVSRTTDKEREKEKQRWETIDRNRNELARQSGFRDLDHMMQVKDAEWAKRTRKTDHQR